MLAGGGGEFVRALPPFLPLPNRAPPPVASAGARRRVAPGLRRSSAYFVRWISKTEPEVGRDDVEVAVRPLDDVGRDPEVAAEEQRLALGDLVLVDVVRDPVVEPGIVDADLSALRVSG